MDEIKKSNRLLKNNMESIILRTLFDDKKYGYEIVKDIEAKTGGEVVVNPTTLYNVLKRLEKQGLITSIWGEESQGGRRKYFSLTVEGFQLCQKQQTEWEYSRHILNKLVSEKDFDGDAVLPEIDITIDKKQRLPREKKPRKQNATTYENESVSNDIEYENDDDENDDIIDESVSYDNGDDNTNEVLRAIDGITDELSSFPQDQNVVFETNANPPLETNIEEESLIEQSELTLESEKKPYDFSLTSEQKAYDLSLENEEKPYDFSLDGLAISTEIHESENEDENLDDEILIGESTSDYYRELDRNIDALMEDDDVIDSTISSTDNLLNSLESTPHPTKQPYEYQTPIGHVNMDYLFNLYNSSQKSEPKQEPPQPVNRVYVEEHEEVKGEKPKSFAEATGDVDIFDEEEGFEEKVREKEAEPIYIIEPAATMPCTATSSTAASSQFVDFVQEENPNERDYKKIINNLLYETRPPKKEEEPLRTPTKTHSSTADKILDSVDAAQYTYNLDVYENTGDIPSGGIRSNPYPSPFAVDMMFDLKERLSQDGIKLRQYEKSPKTTSERYQFYYKNKVLFATLWLVFAIAVIELAVFFLGFKNSTKVTISFSRILVYIFIMLIPPLIGTVINYSRNNVKVRAEWDFGYKIRDALIVFTVGFFVIVAINLLQIFAPFAFSSVHDVVAYLVLPSILLLNVIIGTVVYFILYKSRRYFVK